MSAPREDVVHLVVDAMLDTLSDPAYGLTVSEMMSAAYTLVRCLIASVVKHHPETAQALGEGLYPPIAECTIRVTPPQP